MITRLALRIAAVEALKGRTNVKSNVLDSHIGAVEVGPDGSIKTDQSGPFISVYVEGSKIEDPRPIRGFHHHGNLDIVFEVGITAAMTETDPETDETTLIGYGIPATDAALEFHLDMTGRQIINAMSDPTNEWAEIFRSLMSGIVKIERRRAADAETAVRMAAHQHTFTVMALPDPPYGEPIAETSAWAKLLAKMQAVDHPYLPEILTLLTPVDPILAHEAKRRRFGLTLDEARALADIAAQPVEDTEPVFTSITAEFDPDGPA